MSAILSYDDLNDFISPGLACVKPVEKIASETNDEVEIEVDMEGNASEVNQHGAKTQLSAAQISLADCLACSGCVTSAEEVLVAQHSYIELLKALEERKASDIFVASICHQTRSSLAVAYGRTIEEIDCVLIDLLVNQMGFKYVVGTGLGRKISLLNEANYAISRKGKTNGPVLSSICPGWVLYAEKTHPYVLPNLSNVKSAQQITGCILKSLVSKSSGKPTKNIYHLSIMPCFDKKLESARKEQEDAEAQDVDCVLTAKELVALVEEKYAFRWTTEFDKNSDIYRKYAPQNWPSPEKSWLNDYGSSSGGYAENYLSTVEHLHSMEDIKSKFSRKIIKGKNSDLLEIRLVKNESEIIAKAAIVNGFRNIQNLVRKIKDGETKTKTNPLVARRRARKRVTTTEETADPFTCDYVEIMACPGGCINGGGQISASSDYSAKSWLEETVSKYASIPVGIMDFDVLEWCHTFCNDTGLTDKRLIETWFKEVEKPTDPNAVLFSAKW